MPTIEERVPLACAAGAIPEGERPGHFLLIKRLFSEVLQRQETPGGYAFRFSPERLREISTFIENERRCCPFLAFSVEVPPAGEDIRLRMTGPEGTREFLDAELPIGGSNAPRGAPRRGTPHERTKVVKRG